jgi:hypothetical protein
MVPVFLFLNSNIFPIALVVWGGNMVIIAYILSSHINKLIGQKHKVRLRKRWLYWELPINEYQNKETKLFNKKMISRKAFSKSSKDIALVEILEEEIQNDSKEQVKTYPMQSIMKKGFQVVTLIFGIFAGLILEHSINSLSTSKLIIGFSLILFTMVFIADHVDYLILDLLNAKHRKHERFLKRISHLKAFLKLKYQQNIVTNQYVI